MPKKYGLPSFYPLDAIEGYTDSPVWIVGLNPYAEDEDASTANSMQWVSNVTSSHDWDNIPHFSRLKTVLGKYFWLLGQSKGIASTDIVKCASKNFDRHGTEGSAVSYCKVFLYRQLERYKPKLIIVLGSAGSRYIEELTGMQRGMEVKPTGDLTLVPSGHTLRYVLSGYTSHRMERYAKARLAVDVQAELANVFGVPPHAT